MIDYSIECDPDKNARDNFYGAMARVVGIHREIDGVGVRRVLNAVLDDLKRMMLHQPAKRHRLNTPLRAIFDNIMDVCLWYMGTHEANDDDPEKADSVPNTNLSARALYNGLRKLRNTVNNSLFMSDTGFTNWLRQERGLE